jgi:hypothetical protein
LKSEIPQHIRDKIEKGEEGSFFCIDAPTNIPEAINRTEYNMLKGFVIGTTVLFLAPFVDSYKAGVDGDDHLERFQLGAAGFANGIQRGIVSGVGLGLTGAITGSNQILKGIVEAKDTPGQGVGYYENWQHITQERRFMQLVMNEPPADFDARVQDMINRGALPEKILDVDGNEVPFKYQFFICDEKNPVDFYQGVGEGQYNAAKGFISGAILAVSAPVLDSVAGYKSMEGEGTVAQLEAGVIGLGTGATRGFVGGMLLLGAGLGYGAFQTFRGFASLENIPQGARAWNDWTDGLQKALDNDTHIGRCLLAPGYGLEEFLVWEEEDKVKQDEMRAVRLEEKRIKREAREAAEAAAKAIEDSKAEDK